MSGRVFLTVDEPDGWAVRITDGDPGPVDPEADPALPAGVSHLLVADDALIPGRFGVHITLCGKQMRRPNVTADEHECADLSCDCVHYCPACVREATRLSAELIDGACEAHR